MNESITAQDIHKAKQKLLENIILNSRSTVCFNTFNKDIINDKETAKILLQRSEKNTFDEP